MVVVGIYHIIYHVILKNQNSSVIVMINSY